MEAHSVFGYGSLLDAAPGGRPARLAGVRRAWNVAMDNAVDLAGYKCYVAPDGRRPRIFVAFLNLVRASGAAVNGILFHVGEDALAALDERERNYERVEVTGRVGGAPRGRVWTYVGTHAARARFERGMRERRACVSREYHDQVVDGFAAAGPEALEEFRASTPPPPCPVADLQRVELP